MDIGCRFYTPTEISGKIANHAGEKKFLIDIFSGSGNLYKAFYRKGLVEKILALDINPSVFKENENKEVIIQKVVDCLNPVEIKKQLYEYDSSSSIFVMNPPFKRITKTQELSYWKQFNGYQPRITTQRVECIAIASAIYSAPIGGSIYVILPEIVLDSEHTSYFFDVLKMEYSMDLVGRYKRTRFSSAKVDVAVVVLKKNSDKCIINLLKNKLYQQLENLDINKIPSNACNGFKLFRGKVRNFDSRCSQISVKDLNKGGIEIEGNKREKDLLKAKENGYSIAGDILIARVGRRMMGRVGIISKDCVLTNESVFSLRIYNRKTRYDIYNVLKSEAFTHWCNNTARGTANYFLTRFNIIDFISKSIKGLNCNG